MKLKNFSLIFALLVISGCECDKKDSYDVTSGGKTYHGLYIHWQEGGRIIWVDSSETRYQFSELSYKKSVSAEKE